MATLVRFVKSTNKDFEGEITAVFPQLKYNKALFGNDTLTGYAHIGQHTSVAKEWVKESNVPASEAEYLPLKQELESIGYILKVCKH